MYNIYIHTVYTIYIYNTNIYNIFVLYIYICDIYIYVYNIYIYNIYIYAMYEYIYNIYIQINTIFDVNITIFGWYNQTWLTLGVAPQSAPPSLYGQPLTVRLEQGQSQHVAAPWGIACYGEGETNGAPMELNKVGHLTHQNPGIFGAKKTGKTTCGH